MRRIRGIGFFTAIVLVASSAVAALHFPELTGRVVDNAHLLSATSAQGLAQELSDFETQTGDQLVVVTLPDLAGVTIEEYGYQLGRHWGIGQKHTNKGVLLIVAPTERKVRIEVGYGLEATLTDAVTSGIIQRSILPAFKRGDMQGGILAGAQAIMRVANGGAASVSQPGATQDGSGETAIIIGIILLFLFSQVVLFGVYIIGSLLGGILSLFGFTGLSAYMARMKARVIPADRALLAWLLMPSGRMTGSGGGRFSGGGGSFGGGGSSGSW